MRLLVLILLILASAGSLMAADPQPSPQVTVASKVFTESVILADIATQLAQHAGAPVNHRRQLGGTRILWSALLRGEVDIYPEYTGTIAEEILANRDPRGLRDINQIRSALQQQGIAMTPPLGFSNTYAIGIRQERAEQLGLRTISDLKQHPELKFGFSNEFMDRKDGWPGLRTRYGLPQQTVRGMDHDLAYRAVQSGDIDATDLYSTDAEIRYYNLAVLEDDLKYFPDYQAVYLYRADLRERAPKVVAALENQAGRIDQQQMIAMNARAKLEKIPEVRVASDYLAQTLGITGQAREITWWPSLVQHTREHLALVCISLLVAVIIAIPLGILSAKIPQIGQVILGIVAVLYTIPSLALLVFMIPLLGIGARPAIVALFLYSLLPIVRNTYQGLREIPLPIRESAAALGLPGWYRLLRIELPMASGSILAGIKTAAVINIGTATLGALIGAGGYGQPILTGIRLDNIPLILQGAIPAALLALIAQGLFELAELILVPRGLRKSR